MCLDVNIKGILGDGSRRSKTNEKNYPPIKWRSHQIRKNIAKDFFYSKNHPFHI